MKYQLVLQWPASSFHNYDAMIELENALSKELPIDSEVDGHDAGSGEVNIFVHTNDPTRVFNALKPMLATSGRLSDSRIAYREQWKSEYTILWPKGLRMFSVT